MRGDVRSDALVMAPPKSNDVASARVSLASRVLVGLAGRFIDLGRASMITAGALMWGAVPLLRWLIRRPLSEAELGRRLRDAFEFFGMSFTKLGQYLALRVDLLPTGVCRELDKLFEHSTPLPVSVAKRQIERELGVSVDVLFEWFEDEPIGSATVAQVHRARTHDGRLVAVKIQRPRVRERFISDMRNLTRGAALLDILGLLGRFSLREAIAEFGAFTLRELDFREEGQTAERLRGELPDRAYAPRVHWDLTNSRILTMEFIPGFSLQRLCNLDRAGQAEEVERLLPGVDLNDLVERLADACFHQFFITGHFHGDPHPGNILVESDGRLVFIDHGIFGRLDARSRRDLRLYIQYLALGKFAQSARYYTRLCRMTEWTDVHAWERDLADVLATWHRVSGDPMAKVHERHMSRWQGEIIGAMRRHSVLMREDLLLVWRAMTMLDTTGVRLPVPFDIMQITTRFFERRQIAWSEFVAESGGERPMLRARSLGASIEPLMSRARATVVSRSREALTVEEHRQPTEQISEAALCIAAVGIALLLAFAT